MYLSACGAPKFETLGRANTLGARLGSLGMDLASDLSIKQAPFGSRVSYLGAATRDRDRLRHSLRWLVIQL